MHGRDDRKKKKWRPHSNVNKQLGIALTIYHSQTKNLN